MNMTRIFSDVTANIDNELEKKFPSDFDYLSMIRKVSEDAGVDVQTNAALGEGKQISLHGIWIGIERVHGLLATALAVYGARVTNRDPPISLQATPTSKDTPIGSNSGENDPVNCGSDSFQPDTFTSHDECDIHIEKNSDVKCNKNLLCVKRKNISGNNSVINHSDSVTSYEQDDNTINVNECEAQVSTGSPEERPKHFGKDIDRCRRTKKLPSQQIFSKLRSKFNQRKKYSRGEEDNMKLNKGRGRPKKYSDGDQETLQCPDCDFVAKTRNNLSDHKHRIHQANPSMCDVCQKVFPNRRYMKRHRASHVEPQHGCDVCGKMYKIRKAMIEHQKTHEEGYAKPLFPCQMCPKTFCSHYSVSCHVKSEHLGQRKTFLCSVCGKSFTTKHSLQEHSNAHNGAKPHICEVCGKGFSYESALRDHKFVHVGSKQFICEICSKAFTQRSGLKMHMRIHQESKQFTCNDCGREFTQKQALQRHERVHKGDKPFICKLCSRTFSDASIIRRHMILVHKIHKDARTWREDIICKVKGAVNYHVERISESDDKSDQSSDNTTSTSDKPIRLPTIIEADAQDVSKSSHPSHVGFDNATPKLNSPNDQSEDVTDQIGHQSLDNEASLSWFTVKMKPDVKDVYHPKPQFSTSTSSSLLVSQPIDLVPAVPYGDVPRRNLFQDMPKGQEDLQTNLFSKHISTKYPQYSEREIAYLQSLTANRLPQFISDSDSVRPNEYYESDPNPETRHYQNTTTRDQPEGCPQSQTVERQSYSPDGCPQSQTIERQSYSPESQGPERPTHIPAAYTVPVEGQTLLPQDVSSLGERTMHYPSSTASTLLSEPTTTNTSNFTTAPQPWSMYAYYSHLASQFGMTLGDYPYVTNPGNSHS